MFDITSGCLLADLYKLLGKATVIPAGLPKEIRSLENLGRPIPYRCLGPGSEAVQDDNKTFRARCIAEEFHFKWNADKKYSLKNHGCHFSCTFSDLSILFVSSLQNANACLGILVDMVLLSFKTLDLTQFSVSYTSSGRRVGMILSVFYCSSDL